MTSDTEREKMLAGETYNCMHPDLIQERRAIKRLLQLYNRCEKEDERHSMLHQLLGTIGRDSIIESPFYCIYGKNIQIGEHVYVNIGCTVVDNGGVRMGNHVMIGPSVQIYTAAHLLQAQPRNEGLEVAKSITIEDSVWIGGGAILLPGVSIGRNSVVGAGAVVTRDVPADTVVAGNPARVIREIIQ
ncbi:sugar O-acetyltransferase [Candidatus Bipolaricaulota bacterium]